MPHSDIDLGEITLEDFRQQMPSQLRERLSSALHEQRQRIKTRGSTGTSLTDEQGSSLQELLFYLQHGYLPWYSRQQDKIDIELRFDEILWQAPRDLLHYLAAHRHQAQIRERLQKQFQPGVLERLTQWMAASSGFETTAAAESSVTRSIPASPMLQRLEPGSRLHFEPAMAELLSAILSADIDTIESCWPNLLVEQPANLSRTLRRFGRQAILRRSIATAFPTALFEQMLRLLEPVEAEVLQTLMTAISLVLRTELRLPATRIIEELREFTLHYLFDQRAGGFEYHDYLVSVLRQLALLYSLREDRLIGLVANQIRSRKSQGTAGRGLDALSRQLSTQTLPVSSPDSASVGGAKHDLPDAMARYERLKRRMTVRKNRSRQVISTLFDDLRALRQAAPELLVTLLTDLRGAVGTWRGFFEKLSQGELVELVVALLAGQVVDTPEFDGVVELESSFYRYLAQTRDKREFVMRFLEQWLKNEPLDFHLLADGLRPASPETAPISTRETGSTRPEITEVAASEGSEDDEPIEDIYIGNAGAVLVAPYLPHLFERLGYVEQGRFRSRDVAEHAVHCVQYLVNEATSSDNLGSMYFGWGAWV